MRILWLLVIGCAVLLDCVTSVDLPPMTCPQYFQYLTEGDQFIGKLTLPDLPNEMIIVQLQFSQYEFAKDNVIGNLSLWHPVETAYKNLENQEPVEYRVIFSTQKELPKVTRIAINGIEICTADAYPKPSERIVLQYWFTPPNAKSRKGDFAALPEGIKKRYEFDG